MLFEWFLFLFFFTDQPRVQQPVTADGDSGYGRTVPGKTSTGLPVRFSGHHDLPPPPPPPVGGDDS